MTSSSRTLATRRLLAAAATSALLGGCATVLPPAGLHVEGPLAPQEGAVIVRIVPNAPSAGPYFKNWAGLTVFRVDTDGTGGKFFVVPASLDASSRSALFVASLPPGRYRFTRVSSASSVFSAIQASQWIEPAAQFPSFDVAAGQLTDVGVIVQTPGSNDRHAVELTVDALPDHAVAAEMVRELSPRLLPLLSNPILGWSAGTISPTARSLSGSAAGLSVGITDPHSLPDDTLVAGSYDGMVKWGDPRRPAELLDIGQRVAIETVAPLGDGSWIAAGEYGVIRQSGDRGLTWHSVRGDLPYGLIASVHELDGQVYATVLRGNRVVVASTAAAVGAAPHWTVRATYTLKAAAFWQASSSYATRSFVVGHKLVTALPTDYIGIVDAITGEAVERHAPAGVLRFSAPGEGMLRMIDVGGVFANVTYASSDLGATWDKLPTLPFVLGFALRDKQHGMGWAEGLTVRTGNFALTEDGGRTWKLGQREDAIVTQIVQSADRAHAYAPDERGSLWITDDSGVHWTRTAF